jgi:seryl-tRNA synthetase
MPERVENFTEDAERGFTDADPIEQAVKEQVLVVRGSVKELARVLLEVSLNQAYQAGVAPLDKESSKLWKEVESLRKAHRELSPRIEARSRLLSHEVDACVASGDDAGAVSKRTQLEEEEKGLTELGDKINSLSSRIHSITQEKQQIAVETFERAFPEFPKATFGLIEAVVDLLDALKEGLFAYTQANDISGSFRPFHVTGLTPNELPGSNRQLSRRVDAWFAPKRR